MLCPICDFPVLSQKGLATHFRHQSETHPNYNIFRDNQKWKDKTEVLDFVTCLECGHKAETLARHLLATHNINAEQYKIKWGNSSLIRCTKTTEKRVAAIKSREGGFGKGETKIIICPGCGIEHSVAKFLSLHIHDTKCDTCKDNFKIEEDEKRWEGLAEPDDYVTCKDCGYRAENLTSHLNSNHPDYRKNYKDALVVALGSNIRDKSYWIGKKHSADARAAMSKNAGKWNKGLTKETDKRVESISSKLVGLAAWNKGLTARTHPSIASTVLKLKLRSYPPSPFKITLTLEDFKPFMDSEGKVDTSGVAQARGLSWFKVHCCMKDLGLQNTDRHVKMRAERNTARIEKENLERYSLKNGKVAVGKAMVGLGHSFKVISRECLRHNLKTYTRNIRQTACLNAISNALGGIAYKEEWTSHLFKNPKTGYHFKFDGFFSEIGLIVEFHGHQHYTFPSMYIQKEEEYQNLIGRDRIKEDLINSHPNLKFFKVFEHEPFDDECYLKERLNLEGILKLVSKKI